METIWTVRETKRERKNGKVTERGKIKEGRKERRESVGWLYFYFYIIFKSYFPFTVITKYWLYSVCYTIHPWASLHPILCTSHRPPPLFCPSSSPHWQALVWSVYLWGCFFFLIIFTHLLYFLDSTYKRYHTVFVFSWLISLGIMPSTSIHIPAKWQNFILFYGWVVFHCIYKPHHLYPFICWWTLRLLPYLGKEIFKQTHKTVKNYYFGELELKVMESFFFLSTLFTL